MSVVGAYRDAMTWNDWLLPRHCVVCRSVGMALCPRCAASLRPAPEAPPGPGLDRVVALFAYEGAGRTVIGRLKFDNHRDALGPLAAMLGAAVDEQVDLVTWVPTVAARKRRRGYDQAELIARDVAASLGVPARATVRRLDRVAQTGRGRAERLGARFVARTRLRGEIVAVVDDVRTTGASLAGVAVALRAAGAGRVIGATLAATPGSVPFRPGDPLQSS